MQSSQFSHPPFLDTFSRSASHSRSLSSQLIIGRMPENTQQLALLLNWNSSQILSPSCAQDFPKRERQRQGPLMEIQNNCQSTPEKQFNSILSRTKLTPSIFSEISEDAMEAMFGGEESDPKSTRELCINLLNTLILRKDGKGNYSSHRQRFQNLLLKLQQRQNRVIEEEDEFQTEDVKINRAIPVTYEEIFQISNKNRKRNKEKKKAKISKAKYEIENKSVSGFNQIVTEALGQNRLTRRGSRRPSTYSFLNELGWKLNNHELQPVVKGKYSGWGASQIEPTYRPYRRDSNISLASSSASSVESQFSTHSTHFSRGTAAPFNSKGRWIPSGSYSGEFRGPYGGNLQYKKASIYNTPSSHTMSTSSSQTPLNLPQLAKTGSHSYYKEGHLGGGGEEYFPGEGPMSQQKRKSFQSAKNLRDQF